MPDNIEALGIDRRSVCEQLDLIDPEKGRGQTTLL